jgi:hypothetical protein
MRTTWIATLFVAAGCAQAQDPIESSLRHAVDAFLDRARARAARAAGRASVETCVSGEVISEIAEGGLYRRELYRVLIEETEIRYALKRIGDFRSIEARVEVEVTVLTRTRLLDLDPSPAPRGLRLVDVRTKAIPPAFRPPALDPLPVPLEPLPHPRLTGEIRERVLTAIEECLASPQKAFTATYALSFRRDLHGGDWRQHGPATPLP